MGAEAAYELHIRPEYISGYRTGRRYTLGFLEWELCWNTTELEYSDDPCPFEYRALPRWHRDDF